MSRMAVVKSRPLLHTALIVASCVVISADTTVRAYDERFFTGNDILYYNPDAASCTLAEASDVGEAGVLDVKNDFSLGTDNSKRAVNLVKKLMEDYNFKDFQAAGIVGNFMEESGGQHVPPDVNEGGAVGPPAFSGGYGWAQWTAGRQQTFISFAVSKGYMASKNVRATDAANYAYLNQEFTRTAESKVVGALKQTTTVDEATTVFEDVFERAGTPRLDERIKSARKVLAGVRGGGSIDVASGESSTNTADGSGAENCEDANTAIETQSVMFDKVAFPLLGQKSVVNNPAIFKGGTTSKGGHPYTSYDIYADVGTRVIAFTSGVVTNVSLTSDLGQAVTVYNKKSKLAIYYTHMGAGASVQRGDTVSPGDPIGKVGSAKIYPGVNIDHLHIDASAGTYRVPCSRSSCSASAKSKFRDIGPDLFKTYQELR